MEDLGPGGAFCQMLLLVERGTGLQERVCHTSGRWLLWGLGPAFAFRHSPSLWQTEAHWSAARWHNRKLQEVLGDKVHPLTADAPSVSRGTP